ncbi:MAG TPA: aspartyl/asparaginyl beta-hydroxylase domain-containing protein [Lysobacter sp.]
MSIDSPHDAADHRLLNQLFALAQQAVQQGDFVSAEQLCSSVLAGQPAHAGALNFIVMRAIEKKEVAQARQLTEQALAHAATPELHFLHGRVLEALGDHAAARAAFAAATELDPRCLPALLWQAAQEEALSLDDACLRTSLYALQVAERSGVLDARERLPAELRQRLSRAFAFTDARRDAAVDSALAPIRARHGAGAVAHVDHALQASMGRRKITWPHPLQRPTFLLLPGLEPRPWFDRDDFPFLAQIERHTDAIVEELLGVLADETRLAPYIDMSADAQAAPVWQELNRSTRWSSYHLFRHGERIEEHAQRCPRTMEALQSIPLMQIPEHSPEALFSILKAGTHIPPHTGVINGRLTVHLPLIVPRDCGALKAGGEAHAWVKGRCLIFDDSFVHEAWNTSDRDRAVLIFDIWDPRLSVPEREALSAAVAAIGHFNRTYGSDDPSQGAH